MLGPDNYRETNKADKPVLCTTVQEQQQVISKNQNTALNELKKNGGRGGTKITTVN